MVSGETPSGKADLGDEAGTEACPRAAEAPRATRATLEAQTRLDCPERATRGAPGAQIGRGDRPPPRKCALGAQIRPGGRPPARLALQTAGLSQEWGPGSPRPGHGPRRRPFERGPVPLQNREKEPREAPPASVHPDLSRRVEEAPPKPTQARAGTGREQPGQRARPPCRPESPPSSWDRRCRRGRARGLGPKPVFHPPRKLAQPIHWSRHIIQPIAPKIDVQPRALK